MRPSWTWKWRQSNNQEHKKHTKRELLFASISSIFHLLLCFLCYISNPFLKQTQKLSSTQMLDLETQLQNHFDRLSDDLVLLIINKLGFFETHLRFSVVCKRFASLVPKTHAVKFGFDVSKCGLFKDFFTKLFGLSSGSTLTAKRLLALKNFTELKLLHIEFSPRAKVTPLSVNSKGFLEWVSIFGSNLEFFMLIYVQSIDKSCDLGDDECFNNDIEMEPEYMNLILRMVQVFVEDSSVRYDIAKFVLANNLSTPRTIQVLDATKTGNLVMGEAQIAKCINCESPAEENSGSFNAFMYYMPVMKLKSFGWKLEQVNLVFLTPDAEIDFEKLSEKLSGVEEFDAECESRICDEALEEILRRILENGKSYLVEIPQSALFSS